MNAVIADIVEMVSAKKAFAYNGIVNIYIDEVAVDKFNIGEFRPVPSARPFMRPEFSIRIDSNERSFQVTHEYQYSFPDGS